MTQKVCVGDGGGGVLNTLFHSNSIIFKKVGGLKPLYCCGGRTHCTVMEVELTVQFWK